MSTVLFGRRIGTTLLSAGAIAAACACCGSAASAKQLQELRIAYAPNPTDTTLVVAEQQGFFKQDGLNVKLTSSEATGALLPSIGKQFDLVGITPPAVLQASQSGLKPILVASQTTENTTNQRTTYLIAQKGITSLKQLKGKTIGVVSEASNLYQGTLVALRNAGVSASSVHFLQVPFADMNSDLQSGTIQAAVTIVPFQGEMLGEGLSDLGDPLEQALHNAKSMSYGWVAYKPWVETHKQAILDFQKAQKQALAWIKTHQAASRKILIKDFQLPAVAADKYPLTVFFSFAVKASYLSQWIKPLQEIGDLSKGFKTPVSSLIFKS